MGDKGPKKGSVLPPAGVDKKPKVTKKKATQNRGKSGQFVKK
ncbi:unnamed protein product [marine sediment metagenome]|uniref:Uncharacterized protein n=1 Tax=marine sediment metagenome TaxID=412755 RepID=X1RB89_9ZZZZ